MPTSNTAAAAGAAAQSPQKISVLFVCLGNICRSTMAEGVFKSLTKDKDSPYYDVIGEVDSCGTGMLDFNIPLFGIPVRRYDIFTVHHV